MEGHVLADPAALQSFASDVFQQLDVPPSQAEDAARVLVWANLRGIDTHGVRNLGPLYVRTLDEGRASRRRSLRDRPRDAILRSRGRPGSASAWRPASGRCAWP